MPPQAKSRCFHFYMRKECLEGDMCTHCRGIYFDILLLLPKVKNPERLGPGRLEPHEADGWKRWPCDGPCGVTVSAPTPAAAAAGGVGHGESEAAAAAQAHERGPGLARTRRSAAKAPASGTRPRESTERFVPSSEGWRDHATGARKIAAGLTHPTPSRPKPHRAPSIVHLLRELIPSLNELDGASPTGRPPKRPSVCAARAHFPTGARPSPNRRPCRQAASAAAETPATAADNDDGQGAPKRRTSGRAGGGGDAASPAAGRSAIPRWADYNHLAPDHFPDDYPWLHDAVPPHGLESIGPQIALAEELLEMEETSKHTPTMYLRNSRDDGIQWVLQQLDLTGDDGVEPLRAYRLALRHRNSEALAAVNELRTTLRLTPKESLATELYWLHVRFDFESSEHSRLMNVPNTHMLKRICDESKAKTLEEELRRKLMEAGAPPAVDLKKIIRDYKGKRRGLGSKFVMLQIRSIVPQVGNEKMSELTQYMMLLCLYHLTIQDGVPTDEERMLLREAVLELTPSPTAWRNIPLFFRALTIESASPPGMSSEECLRRRCTLRQTANTSAPSRRRRQPSRPACAS